MIAPNPSCARVPSALRSVLAEDAVIVGERRFSIAEVLASSIVTGDAGKEWSRVFKGAACIERAASDGTQVADQSLQEALSGWRKRRNLFSAHQTHTWLARHGLTLEDLREYLRRRTLIRYYAESAGIEASRERQDAALAYAAAELLLSTRLDDLVTTVAAQSVAAHYLAAGETTSAPASVDARIATALALDGRAIEHTLTIDRAYRALRERTAREPGIEAALRADVFALTQVAYDSVSSPAPHVIHELACCVRYDGVSLRAIAEAQRIDFGYARAFVEDLRARPGGSALASAEAGALVGPTLEGSEWVLHQVTERRAPQIDDTLVRDRLVDRVVGPLSAALIAEHVRIVYLPPTAAMGAAS